jgi:hypothetical protein
VRATRVGQRQALSDDRVDPAVRPTDLAKLALAVERDVAAKHAGAVYTSTAAGTPEVAASPA